MKTINVEIKGTSPLLMNKYSIEGELERQKGRRITEKPEKEQEAHNSAYWSQDGKTLIIPAQVIYSAILGASSFHKIGKRSAKSILAGSIRVEPEEVSLGTNKYEVDVRPVVIQRNRVLKARARLDEWKASFNIVYNEKLIGNPEILRTVLQEAGMRIGICDFRPTKSGFYGCFDITGWKVINK